MVIAASWDHDSFPDSKRALQALTDDVESGQLKECAIGEFEMSIDMDFARFTEASQVPVFLPRTSSHCLVECA